MTSTPFTNALDVLGVSLGAFGAYNAVPKGAQAVIMCDIPTGVAFLLLGTFCFLVSFGIRLENEGHIDKLLDKVRK